MVTAVATEGGTRQSTNGSRGGQRVAPTVPFVRASAEHVEPAGVDTSRIFTTSDQDLGVFDVPAYGYVRSLLIYVEASGGTGGSPAVTATEDAPFAAIKNIALTEPNGAVIAQFNSGYDCYLANKWGGYRHPIGADLKGMPGHVAIPANGSAFSFWLRIPVELNLRDALGSLPNQNASATFKLRLTLGKIADVMTGTLPTTLPTARVRVFLEAWDQPEVQSAGAVNQVSPPALNTTQFWSPQIFAVNAGNNTIRLTRTGNFIRELIFVLRRGGTSRANGNADWPDPLTIYLDTRPLTILPLPVIRLQMAERTGYGITTGAATPANDTPQGLDNGVYVADFAHEFDGLIGRELRDGWMPTLGSTRLEIQGSFANAGTLTVLTNDVAIAGPVFL